MTPKIALVSTWSKKIEELSKLTFSNHGAYAERNGYFWVSYEADLFDRFETILRLLESHDAVLMHGCDTLFMNHAWRVESLPGYHWTLAHEAMSFFPINNDVVLLRQTGETIWLLKKIADEYDVWKDYKWSWQMHLWNLICTNERVIKTVKQVHPSLMNAFPMEIRCSYWWQLGDPIIHFAGLPLEHKITLVKHYLKFPTDGTYFG